MSTQFVNYMNVKLEKVAPELNRTPAAAILRSGSNIYRDYEGNVIIFCRYSYHAEKLMQSLNAVQRILSAVFDEDMTDRNIDVCSVYARGLHRGEAWYQ